MYTDYMDIFLHIYMQNSCKGLQKNPSNNFILAKKLPSDEMQSPTYSYRILL